VKIWKPIIEKLDEKMNAACLRRDAYLAKVLAKELDYLDAEVSTPNSQASYDYVTSLLDAFDRKPVSLALPPELMTRLNEICERKRIVREAFFNRFFLLLSIDPSTVDKLFFLYFEDAEYDDDWRKYVLNEHKYDSPFFQNDLDPLTPIIEPFWAMRYAMDKMNQDSEEPIEPYSVYSTVFTQKIGINDLRGLSCYLPDREIPGHPAEKEAKAKLDELFRELGL
jgi:hypothetical protein